MTSYNIERGEELKGSVDIKTPFAGYEKLSTVASLEFESPTEFDFKVWKHRTIFDKFFLVHFHLINLFNGFKIILLIS